MLVRFRCWSVCSSHELVHLERILQVVRLLFVYFSIFMLHFNKMFTKNFRCMRVCVEETSFCIEKGGLVCLYLLAFVCIKYPFKLRRSLKGQCAGSGGRRDGREIL